MCDAELDFGLTFPLNAPARAAAPGTGSRSERWEPELPELELLEPPFAVRSVRTVGSVRGEAGVVVQVVGGLDIGTAALFEEAACDLVAELLDESGASVRIDLAQLAFCDTAGLDVLSAAVAALEGVGAQVTVVRARRQVRRLLAFATEHCWPVSGPLAAVGAQSS